MQVKEQITSTSETLRVQIIEIYRFRALNALKKHRKFWEVKTKNTYTRLTEYKKTCILITNKNWFIFGQYYEAVSMS